MRWSFSITRPGKRLTQQIKYRIPFVDIFSFISTNLVKTMKIIGAWRPEEMSTRKGCDIAYFIVRMRRFFGKDWCLTLYCPESDKLVVQPNFDFNLRRDHQENFLWPSLLWVGRRKKTILAMWQKTAKKWIRAV